MYIVAIPEPSKAADLIREKVADPAEEIEDLGRVSAALLTAIKLIAGRVYPR